MAAKQVKVSTGQADRPSEIGMQNTSCAAKDQSIGALKKLLRKVELASEGSPKLDSDFVSIFRSAPTNVTRSIDALVRMIETELPGWWWTFGYCTLSNDASLYPPGSARFRHQFSHASMGVDGWSGPEANGLLELPKSGKLFDEGFHCDLLGGTVHLSMLRVFLRAKIALANAKAKRLEGLARGTQPETSTSQSRPTPFFLFD